MPSSHRFSDPAEENNILNHVISEDLQKYGFMYLSHYIPYPHTTHIPSKHPNHDLLYPFYRPHLT